MARRLNGYEAIVRDRQHRNAAPVYRPGYLPCGCWCEHWLFYIPEAMVRRGETVSCGRLGCEPGT